MDPLPAHPLQGAVRPRHVSPQRRQRLLRHGPAHLEDGVRVKVGIN